MSCRMNLVLAMAIVAGPVLAATSEISVNLKLGDGDFVSGERIRGIVDIANSSSGKISVGYANSKDRFFIEVYRASDMHQLAKKSQGAFVSRFRVDSSEGQKLETFLGDHYALREPSHYLAKPVLVHDGIRYEGQIRAFDVVEGIKIGGALQLFANRKNLQREFELAAWSRSHTEHLFLKAWDAEGGKVWETRDLGPILRIEKPTISILNTGEIIIFHRLNQDQFVRSEFWSLPNELEFRLREAVEDPETAGTRRVRDLYKKNSVKAKKNPWWKFW